MISNVVVKLIEQSVTGLVSGKTIFAEHGVGDKNVVVSTTWVESIIDNDNKIRTARINIVFNGYKISEGWKLSENIVDILHNTTDLEVQYDVETTYTIKSVKILNMPTYDAYGKIFSFNFEVYFTVEK